MLLYNSAVSGNCWKVRQMLAHLGIRADEAHAPSSEELAAHAASPVAGGAEPTLPLELRELDVLDRSDRGSVIGLLTPVLRVPVLVLDDGRSLFESNAIIDFLAEGTVYLPTDAHERQQALAWQFFEQYEIEPNLAVARFHRIFEVEPPVGLMAQKQEAGRRGLEALERGLTGREFLVAGRYTVADISLYAYTHVAAEGGFDLEPYPWTRAWLDRVAAQPGHLLITD